MSNDSKEDAIRSFVDKTSATIESCIQFNSQIINTLTDLKKLGDIIINERGLSNQMAVTTSAGNEIFSRETSEYATCLESSKDVYLTQSNTHEICESIKPSEDCNREANSIRDSNLEVEMTSKAYQENISNQSSKDVYLTQSNTHETCESIKPSEDCNREANSIRDSNLEVEMTSKACQENTSDQKSPVIELILNEASLDEPTSELEQVNQIDAVTMTDFSPYTFSRSENEAKEPIDADDSVDSEKDDDKLLSLDVRIPVRRTLSCENEIHESEMNEITDKSLKTKKVMKIKRISDTGSSVSSDEEPQQQVNLESNCDETSNHLDLEENKNDSEEADSQAEASISSTSSSSSSSDEIKTNKNKQNSKKQENNNNIKGSYKPVMPDLMLPKSSDEEDSGKETNKNRRRKSTRLLTSSATTKSNSHRSKKRAISRDEESNSSSSELVSKKKRPYNKSSSMLSAEKASESEKKNSDFESEASQYEKDSQSDTDSIESDGSTKKVCLKINTRKGRKKLLAVSSDESDEEKKDTRRKLRKVIDDKKLDKSTLDALAAEQERRRRIEEKRQLMNTSEIIFEDVETEQANNGVDESSQKGQTTGLFLDVTKNGEKRVRVDDCITKVLKPHQIDGLRFMWDSCFENIEMIAKKEEGSGCVLAHCMGLGKTLQVVALVHTLINNQDVTNVKRVLILLPVNVQINWKCEFKKWTAGCSRKLAVFDLPNEKTSNVVKERVKVVENWKNRGGVFLIGYTMFTRLVQGMGIKSKDLRQRMLKALTSPDLVVCDEGHLLKSEKTNVSKAVNQVETKRRIVLTGTPLQNNLIEYHCMVSFVKPSLLGTKKEFMNRFGNPINNGQHRDSTVADVNIMKRRAHVLHQLLDGCVQRKDYDIIRDLLPPKHEYVILIRMSEKQCELYRKYLGEQRGVRNLKTASGIGKVAGAMLFADFQMLSRIWTHPWLLKTNQDRVTLIESKNIKSFICDESSAVETESDFEEGLKTPPRKFKNEPIEIDSDEELPAFQSESAKKKKNRVILSDDDASFKNSSSPSSSSNDSDIMILEDDSTKKKEAEVGSEDSGTLKIKRERPGKHYRGKTRGSVLKTNVLNEEEEEATEKIHWWSEIVTPDCEIDFNLSGKLCIFEKILEMCQERGDKLIVFSQSLMSLDLIEKFLNYLCQKGQTWKKDKDYFRLDGSTDVSKRSKDCALFNNPDRPECRLFLISTKAGGIGINLVGANRCIVFDASWNPSYDTQSIFRIYRFGQVKPVYIYRFLCQGTMEEKIYQRQVIKQSLAQRVVDEHQLERHFTADELRDLYKFEPIEYNPNDEDVPIVPDDDILGQLLCEKKRWIFTYHEHDSLLENNLSEGLTVDERKAAWNEYQLERQRVSQAPWFNVNEHSDITQPMQASDSQPMSSQAMQIAQAYQNHISFLLQKKQEECLMADKFKSLYNQGVYLNSYDGIGPPQITPVVPQQMPNLVDLLNILRTQMNTNQRREYLARLYNTSPNMYNQLMNYLRVNKIGIEMERI